ncbi:MAG: amidase [Promethearchaeota archaeon]|jgi:Asp-tRNA(Asn)/Glu-tRNA(Gln) amidotransferase A subunit family amidase
MIKEDICFLPAWEMKEKIFSQEVTSKELTEIIIEKIETVNPIINAYCTPTFDLARELAKKADKAVENGENLGILHGIPISIKDNVDVKGYRTTCGCKLFENFISTIDDISVARLKEAGVVILGKTNLPAFGYKGVTDNLIFGETKNPWQLERTCGGSSGGAAAAAASGISPLALGSDGGGSIRIPSGFCGLYGIKPSFGRIPHTSMKIEGNLGTLVNKGPLVRYVKDAALMLDALVGANDIDRYSLPKPNYSFYEKVEEKPKNLKIGYAIDLGNLVVIHSEVEKAVINSVEKFEQYDWSVEKSNINLLSTKELLVRGKVRVDNYSIPWWIMWTYGLGYFLKPAIEKYRDIMDPELVETAEVGYTFSPEVINLAEIQREIIFDNICKHFKEYDILVTPTLATPAFELGVSSPTKIDGKDAPLGSWSPYTHPFNMSGHPAASIPCGWSSDGLPIGMQIIGKRLDDITVLQVSQAFEEIAPWQDKKPKFI